MKRRLLWTMVTILIIFPSIVLGIVREIAKHYIAVFEVFSTLLFRFQHWGYNIERGTFYNCPFKRSLSDVYLDSLNKFD